MAIHAFFKQEFHREMTTEQLSNRRLSGRRILITGAASGIGHATAQMLAQDGASVALLDRDEEGLAAAPSGSNVHTFTVDITREASVDAAVEAAAAAMGGLDGVVNAAGVMCYSMVSDLSAETWRKVIDVNLTGMYLVTRSCLRWMRDEPSASVVNIASAAGLLPNAPGLTAYAASKGGVIALTKALAAEVAPAIRVNCVCPGMVDTPMADGFRGNVGNYALKRLADPQEIVRAIMFLISADASYVTGATLAVDGGRSFH